MRMRSEGHVARMRRRKIRRDLIGKHERKRHLEELVVDESITIKLVLKKYSGGASV
jgi:hypothetical protein